MRFYHDRPSGTVDRARDLRRTASAPEWALLRALRDAFPRLKWRHQTPIGPYYADILCFSERLVIEVDGDTHAMAMPYDTARTAFIEREGYRVIRFANADVTQNPEGVLARLAMSLRQDAAVRAQEKGGTA